MAVIPFVCLCVKIINDFATSRWIQSLIPNPGAVQDAPGSDGVVVAAAAA